jgi:hypothetical protein
MFIGGFGLLTLILCKYFVFYYAKRCFKAI